MSTGERPYDKDKIRQRFVEAVDWVMNTHTDNLTQSDIADTLGILHAALSRIRTSQNPNYPTIDTLAAMVFHYHISAEWLLTGKGSMENTPDLNSRVRKLENLVASLMTKLK